MTNARTMPSACVLQTVNEICPSMGLSFEGFEEESLPFKVIELSHSHKELASSSKLGKKGSKELRR
jgi:hypothetical protein